MNKIRNILVLTILTLVTVFIMNDTMLAGNIDWSEQFGQTDLGYEESRKAIAGEVARQFKEGGRDGTVQWAPNHYTTDSPNYMSPNALGQPGSTVDLGVSLYGGQPSVNNQDGTSSKVDKVTIYYQYTKNVTTEQAMDRISNLDGVDRNPDAGDGDLESSYFADYAGDIHSFEAVIDSNGNLSAKILESIAKGEIAITGIGVDGVVEWFSKANYFFTIFGDESNLNDFGLPKDVEQPPENGPRTPNGNWYWNIATSTQNYSHLEPNRSGVISNDKYDVTTAIPTSEELDFTATADDTLYNIDVRTYTGTAYAKGITGTVTASYWGGCQHFLYTATGYYTDDKGRRRRYEYDVYEHPGAKEVHTSTWTVLTNYSDQSQPKIFYDVPVSEMYPVQNATFHNTPITPDPVVGLTGGPSVGPDTINVYGVRVYSSSTYGISLSGIYDNHSAASNAAHSSASINKIKGGIKGILNRMINRSGTCSYSYRGLNVTATSNNRKKPSIVQTSNTITEFIEETVKNGNYATTGTTKYAGGRTFGFDPNDVLIHTPVVNLADITWRSQFVNQKVTKTLGEKYHLMLDEQFTITIPDKGKHNNYKGYGTRIYNSYQAIPKKITNWGKIKDVKLPFDVYVHYGNNNQKHFLKANTWLSESNPPAGLSTLGTTYTFTIPVWVKEGKHIIQTRVIAENAFDYSLAQEEANYSVSNYVATKNIEVEVIGKIYDLRINASNDPGWADVYNYKTKKDYITATEFPFGQQGHNRVTQYKYAPKLGYTFVFNFKTKGRKSNNIDVSIQPEGFYFIGKDGKNLQEVDLYYNSTASKNIKIDINKPTGSIAVRLTDKFLEVPTQEFVDSNRIYPQPTEIGKVYNYNLSVPIGNFAKMNLPHALRLCYNNFAEYINTLYGKGSTEASISSNAVTRDNVIGSVGHWHAGYRLPASTMAVPAGKKIDEAIRKNTLLKDGYIIVKFDIVTKSPTNNAEDPIAGEPGNNYLRYPGPEALNEKGEDTGITNPNLAWPSEKQNPVKTQPVKLPNGVTAQVPTGSVAIFEANIRSSNDSEVAGTH